MNLHELVNDLRYVLIYYVMKYLILTYVGIKNGQEEMDDNMFQFWKKLLQMNFLSNFNLV